MFDFVAMEAAARAALDGPSPAELRRAAVLAEVRESAPPASLRRRLARLALGGECSGLGCSPSSSPSCSPCTS
jgi:hypothetical protein